MTIARIARSLLVAACAACAVAGCSRSSTGEVADRPSASAAASVSAPAPASLDAALGIAPDLPTSTSTTPAPGDALVVVLSRKGLSLGSDGAPLAVPDGDPNAWSQGFEDRYKRASRREFYLVPLGAALAARYPGDAGVPEATIAAAPSIAYRMFIETLFTLAQERFRVINLLVSSSAGTAVIPFALPGRSEGASRVAPPAALNLNVIITNPGFAVSAAMHPLAPGCHGPGEGVAVPRRDGAYDFAALTACAATARATDPRFAGETRVSVSAEAGGDVRTLVATLDALRGADGKGFTQVTLGVPR